MSLGPPLGDEQLANPLTHEPAYTVQETEFLAAVDAYKRTNRRPYPTWREVLRVLLSLGYRQIAAVVPLPVFVLGHGGATGRRNWKVAHRESEPKKI